MSLLKLVFRNTFRHRLRTVLTILGITVALLAFCMIRTMIDSWYAGVRNSARDRLVVRNAVSLVFYLPISYLNTIKQVPGVARVGFANWFGGKFKDDKYRFIQFAVDRDYLDVYPEYKTDPEELANFKLDREGILVGEQLAERFGIKPGDVIQLQGSIFPGLWKFNVRGIFHGRDENVLTRLMFFHWEYLNERNKIEIRRQPDHAGFYAVQLEPGANPAEVSRIIDSHFANSYAESLTESETAFQQSFVSMSSSIIMALNAVSYVVMAIMLLVLANTMLMSARERMREYSILKSFGFGRRQLALLIFGESALISITGFLLLSLVLAGLFSVPPRILLGDLINFFPVFRLNPLTLVFALSISVAVALFAGAIPFATIMRLKVTDGLRRIE